MDNGVGGRLIRREDPEIRFNVNAPDDTETNNKTVLFPSARSYDT